MAAADVPESVHKHIIIRFHQKDVDLRSLLQC